MLQAEPATAAITRQDQLNSKHTTETPDGGESTGRGRGRGRSRGKGKGRGRSRGGKPSEQDTKNDQPAPEEKAKGRKKKTPDETEAEVAKKPRKTNADKHSTSGWAVWGTDDAWSQGWWDSDWNHQEWAWDSYAWWDGQHSTHNLQTSQQTQDTKPKRTKRRHDDEKGTEAKAPKVPKGNKPDDAKDEADENNDKTKVAPKKTPKSTGEKTKPEKRVKTDGQDGEKHEEAPGGDALEFSNVLPPTKDKRMKKIVGFMNGFKGMDEEMAYTMMRGRLPDVNTCRLNMYRPRCATGLTCRVEKKDVAYFRCVDVDECPAIFRMAASAKAAEMMVSLPQ